MPDVRAEVERAYERAVQVAQSPEHQHLVPYQLAGRIVAAGREHLAELERKLRAERLRSVPGVATVDPAAMVAVEHHPEATPYAMGRAAWVALKPRTANPHDGRSKDGREWVRGWDEAEREIVRKVASGQEPPTA